MEPSGAVHLQLLTRKEPVRVEARLGLTEALMATHELRPCVVETLEWMRREAEIEQSFCAVLEPAYNRLGGVAGVGVPEAGVEQFRLYLEDAAHPLVAALGAGAPVYVSRGLKRPHVPLGEGPFAAFPLRSGSEASRGLLFFRSRTLELPEDVVWAGRMLAERLRTFIPNTRRSPMPSAAELAARIGAEEARDAEGNTAKALFLANVSHELRTPLNAILGYTHMLLDGISGEITPGQRRNIGRVESNARHLLGLINNVLDITRIDSGRMPVAVETFHLEALVHEVLDELEPLILRSKLSVSSRLPTSLPPLTTDRQKLKQILVNLLGNALKFTHEGWVEVSASHQAASGGLSIAVSDSGIGIAPEHQSLLFDDFRQVDDSLTRSYGGAGLGLSISRRLAALLGGGLTLESEPGRGSTFILTIPERRGQENP